MKLYKSLLCGMMAMASLGMATSCQDNIDAPEFNPEGPVATWKPNTTIFDLKREFWDDARNYAVKIGEKPDGSHYIVSGRVITTDEPGNIFKSITIQDETAALTFSVNTYNLFLNYRIGQEIVVDLTGLNIGKYNGLQQVGEPAWYEQGNAWEVSFMPPQLFFSHVQANGLPQADKVIVHDLASIADIPAGADGLCRWQSQLVRLNNITFVPQVNTTTGELITTFGIYKENFNQKVNLDGTELTLRTSGYSDFFNKEMPTEPCDMTCLLSYYGTDWQLTLIDYNDIENVGEPTLPTGTEDNPYNVTEAIAKIQAGETPTGWTRGYIVGTVAPEVSNVTSDADIEWGAEATLANTVVIAPSADCTDFSQCIVIALPQDSPIRKYVALRDHPENLGKVLDIYGTLDTYLGTFGITGNAGSASEFKLEGVDVPDEPTPGGVIPDGDGSEASPYSAAQVVAMGTSANEAGKWVSGYIVGWVDNASQTSADEKNCMFTLPATAPTNVLLASKPGVTDYKQCCVVNLPTTAGIRAAINLVDNPGNLGKIVTVKGTVRKYFAIPGVRDLTSYKLGEGGGDTPAPSEGELWSASFGTSDEGFTFDIISMSDKLTYVWTYDKEYHYLKASAYVGESYASDAWAVSPVLDLAAAKSPVLTFEHVVNKFPSLDVAKRQCSFGVREEGGAWQTLPIANWTDNASWKPFANSGDIDLSAFEGKKVQIGFHYTSENGASGTWEVTNILIKGTGSITVK